MITERPIWIYTDGSAITNRGCLGTYAAVIVFPDLQFTFVAGAAMWTKLNRMELSAVNAALYYIWTFHFQEQAGPRPKVQLLTDSEYVVNCATGRYARNKNRDLWAAFDELTWHIDLSVQHYGRNLEPAQNQCDAACSSLRDLFLVWTQKFQEHPLFPTFQMERGSLKAGDIEWVSTEKTKVHVPDYVRPESRPAGEGSPG